MFGSIALPKGIDSNSKGAFYLRVSTVEQSRSQGDPLGRQKYSLNLLKDCGLTLPKEERIFIDHQSGRKDDRARLNDLIVLIKNRSVEWVATYRVDRMGRDVPYNLKLWELFENTGCALFIFDWGKFVNFDRSSDRGDFYKFVEYSVDADKESHTKAMRTTLTHRYAQQLGKANYILPFGYKRTPEGNAELDYSRLGSGFTVYEIACGRRDIYLETGSFRAASVKLFEKFGQYISPTGFRSWIFNPVLRGHMPRYQDKTRHPNSKGKPRLDRDTHPDQRLISETQHNRIEELAKRARSIPPKDRKVTPLGGLCWCADCGYRMAMVSWKTSKDKEKAKRSRAWGCGGRRLKTPLSSCTRIPRTEWKIIRYEVVEAALWEALAKRADAIANSFLEVEALDEFTPDPDQVKIQAQIDQLRSLAEATDQDLSIAISNLERKLKGPEVQDTDSNRVLREELTALFSQSGPGSFLTMLSDDDRRDIYCRFTDKILISRDRIIDIQLKI